LLVANYKMSSRLSPQAKKAEIRQADAVVSGLAEVSPGADAEKIRQAVVGLGGRARPGATPNTLAFEVAARHLSAVADLAGVVYVTTAEPYGG
jgi:hypothetical protein